MIKFEALGALLCPVFICAQCGNPVQGPGIIQWDNYERPTFTVLHKGPDTPCSQQWDAEHSRDSWLGWRDLDVFLAQLSHNTAHPFTEAA